jgi:hypothetical protein
MVPLGAASRRPARVPVVTALIIIVNAVVFAHELMRGGNIRDAVVRGASGNCFRPSLDHDSDRDVHAR